MTKPDPADFGREPGLDGAQAETPPVLSLSERIDRALQGSLDRCARCKTRDYQVDAVLGVLSEVLAEKDGEVERLTAETAELRRTIRAINDAKQEQPAADDAGPPLPEGIYGRVELPGMRNDTGWITEGMRGGQCVLVVRDWDGLPQGEYILGPACRLVHLPTPLKRPEPQAAITSGDPDPWAHVGDDEPDEDDYDERDF